MPAQTSVTFRCCPGFCLVVVAFLLLPINVILLSGCGRPAFLAGIGSGGKYMEGREEVMARRGNVDKAIQSLEAVVKEDPTYRDSLTLLGRAYYMRERYQVAWAILQRALVVNPEDEIAWMALGMTQLRLGEDEQGLKTVQGGLTLFSKVSVEGYRGFKYWDRAGKVKGVLRRTIVVARKGLEEKENIIRAVENTLAAIDEEEYNLRMESSIDRRREHRVD